MIENILKPYVSERFVNDPAYREGHVRIVNPLPGTVVMGLHVPEMKKIARELAGSGDAFAIAGGFAVAESLLHEEKIVWGLMLDYMKIPLDRRLELFPDFIARIDNWAVCDTVCGAAKWAAAKTCVLDGSPVKGAGAVRETVWDFLQPWWSSCREFEVRFAMIMSMSYFLEEEWLQKVFDRLDGLDFPSIVSEYRSGKGPGCAQGPAPYYARMGAAWLLATALAKFPDRTREYVRGSRLPDDVLRLYVRKARESFRTRTVSPF